MFHLHGRRSSPTDAELAAQALRDEGAYRFSSFTADDAVTLGLSLRKRFRGSSRYQRKMKGLVISIQTIAGHTLFSCTVGDPGVKEDMSLDSWARLDGMIAIVRRTGHSSYYVEKGMEASGKIPRQLGAHGDDRIHGGGEYRYCNDDRNGRLITGCDSIPYMAGGTLNTVSYINCSRLMCSARTLRAVLSQSWDATPGLVRRTIMYVPFSIYRRV